MFKDNKRQFNVSYYYVKLSTNIKKLEITYIKSPFCVSVHSPLGDGLTKMSGGCVYLNQGSRQDQGIGSQRQTLITKRSYNNSTSFNNPLQVGRRSSKIA